MPAYEVQRWHRYFVRYGGDTRTHYLLATLILTVCRALAGKAAADLSLVDLAPWLESETERVDRIARAEHDRAAGLAAMVEAAFDREHRDEGGTNG